MDHLITNSLFIRGPATQMFLAVQTSSSCRDPPFGPPSISHHRLTFRLFSFITLAISQLSTL